MQGEKELSHEAIQLESMKQQNEANRIQLIREKQGMRQQAISYAAQNRVEGEDLLVTAQKYVDFLTVS